MADILDTQIPVQGQEPANADQQALVLPITDKQEENSYNDLVIPADFDEDMEGRIVGIFNREMSRIKSEYDGISWFDRCEAADDEYEGVHFDEDFDADNIDIKLLLTAITIDIIASRAYRQTWGANPAVTMEAEFVVENAADIINKRQDYLDYCLRKKAKLQDISIPIYRAACKYGTTIVKPFYADESNTRTQLKTYRPQNIQDFEAKYAKKLINPDSKEFKEWTDLKSGKTIKKKETADVVIYKGAKMYRVDYKKFFARPKIKDFMKHTVIAELFSYNWYEIEMNVKSGFWDESILEDLKATYGEKYAELDYDFYTCIVQFDKNDDGKTERYLVTLESKTKKFARAIYYPYKHIFFVPYSVLEKDDSWIGYSITDKMLDIASTANAVITSFVKEQDLAHTPLIISDGRSVGDWNIVLGKPNLLHIDPASGMQSTNFMQSKLETVATDRISFLQWIMMYVGVLTGVDPVLLSGGTDPGDKRAAKEKVAMKFQATSMRIEDMIITLQKGDAQVAEQVESIVYQFADDKDNQMKYVKGSSETAIDVDFLNREVRYMMTGSRMAFDKNIDLQIAMQTWDFINKFFPDVSQNLEVRKFFLNSILNNSQGTVEKGKDTIIKPLDDEIQVAKQHQQELAAKVQELKAKGVPDEQIQGFLKSLQQPSQGQGMPPKQPQLPPKQGKPPMPPQGAVNA